MPNLAEFHPQIVHFVVAGAGLGIFFRWVSLTGKLKWTDQAATALIVIGAVAGMIVLGLALWLQLGIENDAACAHAASHGLETVQDLCLKVEHAQLLRTGKLSARH